MESQMYRTARRKFGDTWIEAEFGLHAIGNQAPYMSLTGVEFSHPTSRHDRHWLACGQLRREVLGAFPELDQLAHWHLCTDGIPMHYIANARFWWEGYHCVRQRSDYEPDLAGAFASTIAAGALAGESREWAGSLLTRPWPEVKEALEARTFLLQDAFRDVVRSLPELANATGAKRVMP